jgi:hypothetical protein
MLFRQAVADSNLHALSENWVLRRRMTTAVVQIGGQVLAATRPALLEGGCMSFLTMRESPTSAFVGGGLGHKL